MAKQPDTRPPESAALAKMLDQHVEYVPFLAKDPIKLSPRIVISWLAKPTKSGQTCTPQQALRFVMLCKARGLNPWEGDAYLVGYDTKDGPEFNLITAHQAFLKRAEVHPEYDGMESGVIIKRGDMVIEEQGDFCLPTDILMGGWARVFFKTRKHPMYKRLALAAFQKSYGVWQNNSAGMIVKCAEADALRSSFPNSLGGMYLDTEMESPQAAPIVQSKTEGLKNRIAESMSSLGNSAQPSATPIIIDHREPQPEEQASPAEQFDDAGPIPPPSGKLFADGGADPARL